MATSFYKVYGHTAMPTCLHVILGGFHSAVAELSSCDRHVAGKFELFTLPLRERFSNP